MLLFALFPSLAEPPPMATVEEGVHGSEHIVVAKPVRVEFQALEAGQVIEKSSLRPYWVEYRVQRVIRGDSKPDQVLRVHTLSSGCEPYRQQVFQQNGRYIERAVGLEIEDRVLDPSRWLASEPVVLLIDEREGRLENFQWGVSPEPATAAHLARVERLAAAP